MRRCGNWGLCEVSVQDDAFLSQGARETHDGAEEIRPAGVCDFQGRSFRSTLRTHKIHGLSVRFGRTIYSVWVEADLRAVFYLDGEIVVSVDVGAHSIYR